MNENGTLDDLYFEWLYSKIGAVRNRNPARSYWSLAKHLYTKPFEWTIPNDDNREADGLDLRNEFQVEAQILEVSHYWRELDCSVLEMLVALSRRVAFESSGEPGDWFWKFLENLGLRQFTDDNYRDEVLQDIENIVDRFVQRKYEWNGVGGLFPLDYPHKDQREVELWYQMSSYLAEHDWMANGP